MELSILVENLEFSLILSKVISLKANGLLYFTNEMLKTEDSEKIFLIEQFYNYLGEVNLSYEDIQKNLRDERFICWLFTKITECAMIFLKKDIYYNFNLFKILDSPFFSEKTVYNMPREGICYGSCALSISCKINDFSDRNFFLENSTRLQKHYLNAKKPQPGTFSEFFENLIKQIQSLPFEDKPHSSEVQGLFLSNSQGFNEFLKKNNINVGDLFLNSIISNENGILNPIPEFQLILNAETIINDCDINEEFLIKIFEFLEKKINTFNEEVSHNLIISFKLNEKHQKGRTNSFE